MAPLTLQQKYQTEVAPELAKLLGYRNVLAIPRIEKVVINAGVGRIRDEKQLTVVREALALITGQKVAPRPAKLAIAAFKTRQGLVVGYQATLRGRRMWDFLSRLIHVALPRQRDFRGIDPKAFDQRGNLTIGIKEHIVFPELIGEDVPFIFGFEVTVVTTAKRREDGIVLLKALGFPIIT
ncbi:MAG: 50S ribosomal protein L5 [Candidatus Sungbacteria bacterium]|uniref:Large ribosomal subunit protein uL5 n=1 Tax=Candidatus Sungiibacteriota bacterium TaxID=2750080 RepID=A0A932YW43_9BACT|nr:50S ribosomal protein L5 [Candidatus Sungbacteria bacterium]